MGRQPPRCRIGAAQYHRIAARRGKKRAILAIAHSILVIIYHMLRDGSSYADLGGAYFDERNRESTKKRAVQRLERLGYPDATSGPA